MGTHPMLDPDSTVRLVYEALSVGDVMTQGELSSRVGRTQGSVCKAVQLLVTEGYARCAGKAVNRNGRSTGKSLGRTQLQFAATGKAFQAEGAQLATPAALELVGIVDAWVRRRGKG